MEHAAGRRRPPLKVGLGACRRVPALVPIGLGAGRRVPAVARVSCRQRAPSTLFRRGHRRGGQQVFVDVVADNHPVVHGSQPAGHDDAHRAGVEQSTDLRWQILADLQALKLGAKRGTRHMFGVMLERSRCGRFDVVQFAADVRHVLLEALQRRLFQFAFFFLVFVFRQVGPVHIVGIGGRHNQVAIAAWTNVRVVETESAAADIHAEHGLDIKAMMLRMKQQVAAALIERLPGFRAM